MVPELRQAPRPAPLPGQGGAGRAAIVATLATPPSPDGRELAGLPATVGCLEVRADLAGDLDPGWLRQRFAGELLYTLRSRQEGGAFAGPRPARHRRLRLAAARGYDLVDLEAEQDLHPDLLASIPAERRRISWHGTAPAGLAALHARFQRMAAAGARCYLLAPAAASAEDALAPLLLLRALGRADATAFATGPAGTWSRLLAPRLGARVVSGRLGGAGSDGAPAVEQLIEDYGLPALPPLQVLYGIAGRSVGRSLSPRLHNAAYRALGLPALYLPFQVADLASFWEAAVPGLERLGFPLLGITVIAPHKEAALALAAEVAPLARRAGAANALVRRGSAWRAGVTDPAGVVGTLARAGVRVAGLEAAVVGCGGAGRGVAAGLLAAGARVTLVNRGVERGRYAARLLGAPFVPLAGFSPAAYPLVVHATPVADRLPFPVDGLGQGTTLVDLVYGEAVTPLVAAARKRGATAIDGREVLLAESRRQFRLMTGRRLPVGPARALVGLDGPVGAPWRAAGGAGA